MVGSWAAMDDQQALGSAWYGLCRFCFEDEALGIEDI